MIVRSSIVKTSLSVLIVGVVFYFMGREMMRARAELGEYFTRSIWLQSVIYFAFMALLQLILIHGWKMLLKLHGVQSSFNSIMYSFSIPNLVKYIPGKIVFLVARIELARKLGISRLVGFQCFILENIYIAAASALLSLPAVLIYLGVSDLAVVGTILTAAATSLILMFNSVSFQRLISYLLIRFEAEPADTSRSRPFDLGILLNYLMLWVTYGLAGSIITIQIFDVAPMNSFLIGSIFIAAWLGGYLAFITPGGLGVREGLLVIFLAPLLGAAEASALAVLTRVIFSLAELAFSLLAVMIFPRHNFSVKQ